MERELNLIDIKRDKDSKFISIEKEELQRLRAFENKVLNTINTIVGIAYVVILLLDIFLIVSSLI